MLEQQLNYDQGSVNLLLPATQACDHAWTNRWSSLKRCRVGGVYIFVAPGSGFHSKSMKSRAESIIFCVNNGRSRFYPEVN